MTLPAIYLLLWVFAKPDGTEEQILFSNQFQKIECLSKATELSENVARQEDLKLTYSRFVCVLIPALEGGQ